MVTRRGYVDWEAYLPRGWRRGSERFDAPWSASQPGEGTSMSFILPSLQKGSKAR
jgi:hypothetical protein